MTNYVIAPTYQRFAFWCSQEHLDPRDTKSVVYCTRNSIRGRTLDQWDIIHVLVGATEHPDYDDVMHDLKMADSLGGNLAKWAHERHYDLPRPGEDLEDWLAR